jgi:RecJ-like exonuclease
MSNGLSGNTQYINNYEQDRLDRIRENKRIAFENYVNSYMVSAQKKRCTCSACKSKNAIHTIEVVRTPQGVQEVWRCDHCDRIVTRTVSNELLVSWLDEDRRQQKSA